MVSIICFLSFPLLIVSFKVLGASLPPLKLKVWTNLDFSLGVAKGLEVVTLMCPMTHHLGMILVCVLFCP
jgi:hypothetical protein